jgi:hypothetical protein
MKLLSKALILSTSCLALTNCAETVPVPLNVKAENPERFLCQPVPEDRPALPSTHTIDWGAVETVEQAQFEHDAYVASILDRNGIVTGYILDLEGRLFTCWNNMQWQNEYYDGL